MGMFDHWLEDSSVNCNHDILSLDKVFKQYQSECLNNDGDYKMSFYKWLKLKDYKICK